jgi:hypothetical protein
MEKKNVKLTVMTTMQLFDGCKESGLPLIRGTEREMLGHRFPEE